MKILVVEDHLLLGDSLRLYLPALRKTWTVRVAETRGVALDLLCEEPFDAVVLDLMLPDAPDLVMLLADTRRAHPSPKRIVIASAHDDAEALALTFGCVTIRKPYDIAALIAALETP